MTHESECQALLTDPVIASMMVEEVRGLGINLDQIHQSVSSDWLYE